MAKTEEMLTNGGAAPSYDSICELSSLLYAADIDQHEIPTQFFVPESCRPTLPFDAVASPGDPLPELDLADMDRRGEELAAKLTEMCEEWGFVRVINHGVPLHILGEIASFGHAFFSLPTEHKKKGETGYLEGYGGKHSAHSSGQGSSWVEVLTLQLSPQSNVATFEAQMWPEHPNDAFRKTVQQFDAAVQKLKITLLRLLAEGLGLETTFFSGHFEECTDKLSDIVHFNYYPPCPDPSKVLGLLTHTDGTCLTVVFEDQVGGLQVQDKAGGWHPVHHKQDSLVVIVGDILQGWSNGRLPAVMHRVVLNNKIPRLSVLHATSPAPDFLIQPAPLGAAPRYKAFCYKDILAFKIGDGLVQRHGDARKHMDAYGALDPVDVAAS